MTAYRAVYTVKFSGVVYVLHTFQKEIEIRHRNSAARHSAYQGAPESGKGILRSEFCATEEEEGIAMKTKITRSSGNVFADLGLPYADEHLLKAQVAAHLGRLMSKHGLTQNAAAVKLGIRQPDVSRIRRGQLSGFSLARMFMLVRALGEDVEMKFKPARHAGAVVSDDRLGITAPSPSASGSYFHSRQALSLAWRVHSLPQL